MLNAALPNLLETVFGSEEQPQWRRCFRGTRYHPLAAAQCLIGMPWFSLLTQHAVATDELPQAGLTETWEAVMRPRRDRRATWSRTG